MEKGQVMERGSRVSPRLERREGETKSDPFRLLTVWMVAHVATIAREWDSGPGRKSWEAYRQRQGGPSEMAVRRVWLSEVRAPAIRNWTLAAAIEQGVVSHHDAVLYAMEEGIAGYKRHAVRSDQAA